MMRQLSRSLNLTPLWPMSEVPQQAPQPKGQMYSAIIERVFQKRWMAGCAQVDFHRSDIEAEAAALGVKLPKNLGDLIYSFRFRRSLPSSITDTAMPGQEWIIELTGSSTYRFSLARISRIRPQTALAVIDIPNATPEIVLRYAPGDEQALLADRKSVV